MSQGAGGNAGAQGPAAPVIPNNVQDRDKAIGRSKQLKNLREATRSFKDHLTETGGLYDGKDGDKVLEFVAIGEEILHQYQTRDMNSEDRCGLFFNCLAGTAKEILRSAKLTQPGVLTDVEELKTTLISEFMGEGSMFNLRAKAWSTYQKNGESAREWAARITLLLTYNSRKELIDSKKYSEYIEATDFANPHFKTRGSPLFRLYQYEWMSIKYYDAMMCYFTIANQSPPWQEALLENYKDESIVGADEERMAMSEGGGDIEWDGINPIPPSKEIFVAIPYYHKSIKWGPVGEDAALQQEHHIPLNNYKMECADKGNPISRKLLTIRLQVLQGQGQPRRLNT